MEITVKIINFIIIFRLSILTNNNYLSNNVHTQGQIYFDISDIFLKCEHKLIIN